MKTKKVIISCINNISGLDENRIPRPRKDLNSTKGLQCEPPWTPANLPLEILEHIFSFIPDKPDETKVVDEEKVFKFNKKDRKLRLVSQSWKRAATNVIRKSESKTVKDSHIIGYRTVNKLFANCETPEILLKTLLLKTSLGYNANSPSCPSSDYKKLERFLKSYGTIVKKLVFFKTSIDLNLLKLLLLKWCPLVKEIRMQTFCMPKWNERDFNIPPKSLNCEKLIWKVSSKDRNELEFKEKPMIISILNGCKDLKYLKITLPKEYFPLTLLNFFAKLKTQPEIVSSLEELHLYMNSGRGGDNLTFQGYGILPSHQVEVYASPFNVLSRMEFGSRIKKLSIGGHKLSATIKDIANILVKLENSLEVLSICLKTKDSEYYTWIETKNTEIDGRTANLLKLKELNYLVSPDMPSVTIEMLGSFPNLECLRLGFNRDNKEESEFIPESSEDPKGLLKISTIQIKDLIAYFYNTRGANRKKKYSFEKLKTLAIYGTINSEDTIKEVCNLFSRVEQLEVGLILEERFEPNGNNSQIPLSLNVLEEKLSSLKTLILTLDDGPRKMLHLDLRNLILFQNLSNLKISLCGIPASSNLDFPPNLWQTVSLIPKLKVFTYDSGFDPLLFIVREDFAEFSLNFDFESHRENLVAMIEHFSERKIRFQIV